VLVFAAVNGLLLYATSDGFQTLVTPASTGTRALQLSVALVVAAVVGYVLWSLTGFFRQLLEGQRLRRGSRLSRRLTRGQVRHRDGLRRHYREAREAVAELNRHRDGWRQELRDAARDGAKAFPGRNAYGPGATVLAPLRSRRTRAEAPTVAALGTAVRALAEVLRANDIAASDPGTGRQTLAEDRQELYRMLDYAEEEWTYREATLATRLQLRFGAEAAAATAFGNVGESLRSYTVTRYRMDVETFWSRLQPVLQQRHQETYSGLQDAKTQLDFLVSCVVLSAATTAGWLGALLVRMPAVLLLVALAVLGPLATWMFYLAAAEVYVAFTETVRAAIDLHRLDLLDALQLRRPSGLREERALWAALQQVSTYGVEWLDIGYRPDHDPEAPA
jgi:hypothetical protein